MLSKLLNLSEGFGRQLAIGAAYVFALNYGINLFTESARETFEIADAALRAAASGMFSKFFFRTMLLENRDKELGILKEQKQSSRMIELAKSTSIQLLIFNAVFNFIEVLNILEIEQANYALYTLGAAGAVSYIYKSRKGIKEEWRNFKSKIGKLCRFSSK